MNPLTFTMTDIIKGVWVVIGVICALAMANYRKDISSVREKLDNYIKDRKEKDDEWKAALAHSDGKRETLDTQVTQLRQDLALLGQRTELGIADLNKKQDESLRLLRALMGSGMRKEDKKGSEDE